MRLKKVTIRSFRAIKEMELELDPRLTVLIGDNAAGKTCILDAISMGLSPIAGRARGIQVLRMGSRHIRRVEGLQDLFAFIRLESQDGMRWERRTYRDPSETTRTKAHELVPPIGGSPLFSAIDPVIAARGEGRNEVPLPVFAYYGTDRSVVHGDKAMRQVPIQERSSEKPPWKEAYRGAVKPAVNFSRLLLWFEAMEAEELRRRRDEDPNWVHPQLAAVRRVVELVIPGARNVRVSAARQLEVDLREVDGHNETLSLNELSGGYRTVLALVADLARRMAQINPTQCTESEAIVLIDEVDLHLHPRWQQTILDSLLNAFPNAQFIVSTHSEQVIGAVTPQHIVRLERVPEGVALSRPSSTYGATPDRISEDVMGLPSLRARDVELTLERYWDLIKENAGESDDARALRARLDEWFRGEEPEMLQADAEIRRRKMVRKLQQGERG